MHIILEDGNFDKSDFDSIQQAAECAARDYKKTAKFELYTVRPFTPEEMAEFTAALEVARVKEEERSVMRAQISNLKVAREKALSNFFAKDWTLPPEVAELDARIKELNTKLDGK